jgi:hypothetical protein
MMRGEYKWWIGALGMAGLLCVTGWLAFGLWSSRARAQEQTRRAAELAAQVEHMEQRLARVERAPQPEPIVVHKSVSVQAADQRPVVGAAQSLAATRPTHVEHLGRQVAIPQGREERLALSVQLKREAYGHYFAQRSTAPGDEEVSEQLDALLDEAGLVPRDMECRAGACHLALSVGSTAQGKALAASFKSRAKELKLRRFRMIPQGPDAPLEVEIYMEQEGSRPILPPSL